jgi:hypothetical protein
MRLLYVGLKQSQAVISSKDEMRHHFDRALLSGRQWIRATVEVQLGVLANALYAMVLILIIGDGPTLLCRRWDSEPSRGV